MQSYLITNEVLIVRKFFKMNLCIYCRKKAPKKQRESLKTYFKNKQKNRQTKAKLISVYVYDVYAV